MRLLFVCARNRLRSPTAERVFAAVPGVEAESADVAPDAESPVTPELVEWTDLILVMEPAHRSKLAKLFPSALRGKLVVRLDVPDGYAHMDPGLVDLLWERVTRIAPRAGDLQTGMIAHTSGTRRKIGPRRPVFRARW